MDIDVRPWGDVARVLGDDVSRLQAGAHKMQQRIKYHWHADVQKSTESNSLNNLNCAEFYANPPIEPREPRLDGRGTTLRDIKTQHYYCYLRGGLGGGRGVRVRGEPARFALCAL